MILPNGKLSYTIEKVSLKHLCQACHENLLDRPSAPSVLLVRLFLDMLKRKNCTEFGKYTEDDEEVYEDVFGKPNATCEFSWWLSIWEKIINY